MAKHRILTGSLSDRINRIADGSIHSVVTSPPYFSQRLYGDDSKELGNEPTAGDYAKNIA